MLSKKLTLSIQLNDVKLTSGKEHVLPGIGFGTWSDIIGDCKPEQSVLDIVKQEEFAKFTDCADRILEQAIGEISKEFVKQFSGSILSQTRS